MINAGKSQRGFLSSSLTHVATFLLEVVIKISLSALTWHCFCPYFRFIWGVSFGVS